MPTKHHKPEQIIAKLRQIEVYTAQANQILWGGQMDKIISDANSEQCKVK